MEWELDGVLGRIFRTGCWSERVGVVKVVLLSWDGKTGTRELRQGVVTRVFG